MQSVVIIESPFQLLGAIEAKNTFKINELILIIKYTNNPKTNNQIDWILSKNTFQKVIKMPKFKAITLNDFLLAFLIFSWKIRHKCFEYILIGEPRSMIMNCFILNFYSDKYYFLDDGSATIILQDQIFHNKKIEYIHSNKPLLNKIKLFIIKLLGIKYQFDRVPHLYTCFNLQAKKGQEIIQHSFDYAKKLSTKINISNINTVYFIGSNLSEGEAMSLEHELLLFSNIVNYYKNHKKQIIYCCHRRESKNKLDKIKEIDPTLELYLPEYPIELEFIIKEISVNNIGSYCSTALYTSTLIFKPEQSVMFKIPKEFLFPKFVSEFENLEKNYTNNNFIHLEENYCKIY